MSATEDLLKAAEDSSITPEMVENLIKLGADVNANSNRGMTALMWANYNNTNPEILNTLIKAGADVNAKDNDGETALMVAVTSMNSNPEVVKTLIKAGADILAKNYKGRTVLDYAEDDEIKRILQNAMK